MNTKLLVDTYFTYSENVNDDFKPLLERAYFIMRNKACDLLNPRYEKWNHDYGDVKNLDDYNKYIDDMSNNVLDDLNRKNKISPVKIRSEEGDLIGIIDNRFIGNGIKMYLSVIPVQS